MPSRSPRARARTAVPAPLSESRCAVLPLGALAAGFGAMMINTAVAQPAPAESTLKPVKVRAAVEDDAKANLQTTQSTLRGAQSIRDVPQSMTVVTEKLLDDAKLDTLKQALHYTAGITFAATENGTDQDIRLRGFPVATTGDLLLDGMKDPSQYDRDSFNYERIEVLRGSASMLFGRGSTGGVINQVSKKPELTDVNEVTVSYGSGANLRFTGDFNGRVGETTAVRVNTVMNGADNHGAAIDKQGIAPSISWGIGTPDQFTLSAYYLNVDNVPQSSLRYLDGSVNENIDGDHFYGTRSDYLRGRAAYVQASWVHAFDNNAQLRTQFRTGKFQRSAWGTTAGYCAVPLTATGTCPAGTPAITGAQVNGSTPLTRSGLAPRNDEVDATYFQSDYAKPVDLWGMRHELLAGVDASFETANRYGAYGPVGTNYNKGGTTVGTPDDGTLLAVSPTFRPTEDYKGASAGAFLQDLVWLTPQLKLLGGVRYDWVKTVMRAKTYTAAGVMTEAGSKLLYPSLWSGRAGLLYQPTGTQSYHLSWGTSFNTSADTYRYTNQQTADVDAEKSRNIELGAKLDWLDGQLSTRGALFRTEKYNERTTDSDFAGTYPVLSGKRHSQGFEIDVVGRVTKALELYLSYSHIFSAKIDKAGTAVTGQGGSPLAGQSVGLTPKNSGAAWFTYEVVPDVRIGAAARGASENRPLQGGTGAASMTARAPGYVAYDLMGEYKVNPDVALQFNVWNVTDKVYGDQLYPGFYTAGEGRALRTSVRVTF